MKITQDVRKYAQEHGLDGDDAVAAGMSEKAEEFKARGAKLY
jgi:phosphomethylpyrimidine synthase